MLLDFAKIPVEPVANMRGGQGTVLLQKTVQGPVKVMRGGTASRRDHWNAFP